MTIHDLSIILQRSIEVMSNEEKRFIRESVDGNEIETWNINDAAIIRNPALNDILAPFFFTYVSMFFVGGAEVVVLENFCSRIEYFSWMFWSARRSL